MKAIRTVCLNGLIIPARIGVHDFERETLADFQFDIKLTMAFQPKTEPVELEETVDYSEVLDIIKKQTLEPEFLMETVLNRIALKIFEQFPEVMKTEIHLQKLNPPLDAVLRSSSVKLLVCRE